MIGVTGGIGCGKSEVCRMLEGLGAKVIDADFIAKEITDSNQTVREQIRKTFGQGVFLPDGGLDRRELARIVFTDKEALQKLNKIVHPYMVRAIGQEVKRAKAEGSHPLIVINAALIYEIGMEKDLDYVVVVSASLKNRIQRIIKRDGLSKEEILNRIKAQMPLEEKAKRADHVIQNDGTLEELQRKVRSLYEELIKKGGA